MAEQYQEGEVLKGSDGKTYIVVGGVPREQVSAPAIEGGVYRLPTSPQKAAKEEREARAGTLAEEAAARAAREEGRGIEEKAQGRIDKYRVEFLGMPEVKDFRNVLNATQQITALAQGEGSAMGDLASIFSYMKTLDPGSTVREGEAASAQNAAGIPERIRNVYNNLLSGERLSPEQRADMANTAITLYKSRANNYNSLANTYRGLLSKAGANPDEQGVTLAPSLEFKPAARETGGGQEGPTVSVTPEASIQAFGDYTGGKPGYDAQGNIVGLDYAVAGNTVYDENGKPLNLPLMGRVTEEAVQEAAPSFYEGLVQSVTGEDKSTTATETLPDWVEMPELQKLFSIPSMKVGLSTALGGGPQEIAQIVQSNFPDTKVFQDEKGNYILQSPSTGQRYAIKPGFQLSDVPRALSILLSGGIGGGGAGATALRTGLREAGMQTGIEALQSAAGGTFNPADIIAAGAMGGGGQKLVEALPGAVQAVRGMRSGAVPTRVAAATDEFAMPAPGGIPMPGGRVTPAPVVPATVATEEVAAAGPRTFEAGEVVTSRAGGAMGTSEEAIRTQRAQELPVPIELARFQRTRNFVDQQRARELAKNNEVGGPIRERMTQQQDALRQNFDRFIEGTGSQVWENPYEQGGVIADALATLAKRERTKMKALYNRADNAGETLEPVSYGDVITFINEQTPTTREKLAPVLKAVQEEILKNDPQKTGTITLRAMEDVRKLINKVAQPNTADYAFGKQMKEIIDSSTENAGGELYKRARAARAKYAQDFENIDLVQKVFANKPGSTERYVALEKVTDRITGQGTPLDSVNHLLGLLDRAGPRGERAKRELQGAVMEKIRDQAYRGITKDEAGNVVIQPAALDKIIVNLDKSGKLDAIFDRKTADLLRTVNEVAKDVVTAPPGSVNASGTSSAVMNAIDTVATFGTTGIPVPAAKILNELRKSMATRQLKKEVKRLLD